MKILDYYNVKKKEPQRALSMLERTQQGEQLSLCVLCGSSVSKFVSFVVKDDNAVVKNFNTDSPNMLQKGTAKKRGMFWRDPPFRDPQGSGSGGAEGSHKLGWLNVVMGQSWVVLSKSVIPVPLSGRDPA